MPLLLVVSLAYNRCRRDVEGACPQRGRRGDGARTTRARSAQGKTKTRYMHSKEDRRLGQCQPITKSVNPRWLSWRPKKGESPCVYGTKLLLLDVLSLWLFALCLCVSIALPSRAGARGHQEGRLRRRATTPTGNDRYRCRYIYRYGYR